MALLEVVDPVLHPAEDLGEGDQKRRGRIVGLARQRGLELRRGLELGGPDGLHQREIGLAEIPRGAGDRRGGPDAPVRAQEIRDLLLKAVAQVAELLTAKRLNRFQPVIQPGDQPMEPPLQQVAARGHGGVQEAQLLPAHPQRQAARHQDGLVAVEQFAPASDLGPLDILEAQGLGVVADHRQSVGQGRAIHQDRPVRQGWREALVLLGAVGHGWKPALVPSSR